MRQILIVLLLLFTSLSGFGQNNLFKKADSLKKESFHTSHLKELHLLEKNEALLASPELQLKLYVKLMEYYRLIEFNQDSIIKFYKIGNQLALDYNNEEYLYNFQFM